MSEPIEKKNASNHMTNEEIIVRYRQAKDKTEQVKILADLNTCTTDKIINILVNEGGYKIQHFNKLIRKLNNGGKTVPNKKEYKKPEIITEEKAINLEKSAAEFVAEKTEDELADLKKCEEMYKLEINKIKTIKPDDVLGTTKAITEDENGVTFDIELTDKGKTAINEIIKPLEWVPEISLEEYGKMYDEDRKIYDSPASVGKMTCNICKHYNGIENRCLKTKKIRTPIHICDVEETERLKYSSGIESLDNAIEIVHAKIERIDKEIAELRALRAEIIAACQGGVPF